MSNSFPTTGIAAGSPELAPVLLRLARKSFTGMVRLSPPEGSAGEGFIIHLTAGQLDDAIPELPPSILDRTIREPGLLGEADLKKLEKQARQEGWTLSETALAQGLFSAEEISAAIVQKLARMFGDALAENWTAHEENTASEGSPSAVQGLAQYFQLSLPVAGLLFDGARARGGWQRVRNEIPELREVYACKPSAAEYVDKREEFPIHADLIDVTDGARDLAEAIEACGHDPFDAYECFQQLVEGGNVEALNPVQIFQLGCDLERGGSYAKALRLFERAEERGLDDFDLGYRLGELYARIGKTREAVERFLTFAEKCVSQYRIEDTIRACRRILDLDPENMQVLERYVSLLARYGKREEALREGLALSRKLAERGEKSRAVSSLEKIIELADANEEVLRFYLDLSRATGHQQGTVKAQRRLANLFHQREDMSKALEFYQGLFVNKEDGPDVRCRLVELHFAAGQRGRAVEHLLNLQCLPGWSARNSEKDSQEFYRRLLTNGIREPEITAWLAEDAGVRGKRQDALRYLDLHCQLLEAAGRLEEARRTAQQIVRLDPRNLVAARRLSTLELRFGNKERASLVLEQLASRLEQEGTGGDELREILEELVVINPLSIIGRKLLLPLSLQNGPSPKQSKQVLEMLLIKLVAGEYVRAEAMLDEFPEGGNLRLPFYLLAGHLTCWQGDAAKAQFWFGKGARLAAESGDRGSLRKSIESLRAIDPKHGEIAELERILENLSQPELAPSSFNRGPEKLLTKVSGITARLRSMKGQPRDSGSSPTAESAAVPEGGCEPNSPPVSASNAPKTAVPLKAKGVEALKKLRGREGEAPAPGTQAAAATSDQPESSKAAAKGANTIDAPVPLPPPIPSKVKGIAALKRLRESQAGEAITPETTGTAP